MKTKQDTNKLLVQLPTSDLKNLAKCLSRYIKECRQALISYDKHNDRRLRILLSAKDEFKVIQKELKERNTEWYQNTTNGYLTYLKKILKKQ